ncbi:MAG: sulfite exporter TauE/SafE family protein [Planctomycetota bacterium]
MSLLAVPLAILVGLSMGLLGAGGSILTVPILAYLLGHEKKAAIAESLGIVAGLALLAVLARWKDKLIDWRSVLFFGPPSIVGTYLGAWVSQFVHEDVQMTLFAVVLLAAARAMLKFDLPDPAGANGEKPAHLPWPLIILEGLGVGALTGLVGVGGGFMIVPALVLLGKVPIQRAVQTSLTLIALKSIAGFIKYIDVLDEAELTINWWTVGAFIVLGTAGGVVGLHLRSKFDDDRLRRAFGWFILLVGVIVFAMEMWAISQLFFAHTGVEPAIAEHAIASVR